MKQETWSFPGNVTDSRTEGYAYDYAGRMTRSGSALSPVTYTYDARGNVLTAGGNSYTYSGDKLTSLTPSGQSAVSFTHDTYGRMTTDGLSGSTIGYNHMDLPAKISQSGSDLAKYSYLANGSKSKAENGSGVGLVYRGSLIYRKAANGTLTLEGATLPEGRLTVNGVRWHVKDHLGSVRAVVDGSTGNLLAVTDYDAYGEDAANSTASPYLSPAPSGETFRERFTGKEDQGPDFSTAYTDFGARQYSPTLRRWLVPDPLSEKYYGISPYAYCAGNPVNLVDLDGNSYSDFDINGNYIQTTKDNWWHNFWHGRTGRIVDDNGNVVQSFRFADPKHDVDDLKKGKIDRIQVVQENEIISMLSKAGAFSEENKAYNNDIVDRYAYILKESPNGGKFDFALTGIPTLYNNYDQSLFLVNGVAHNRYNYGNFIWGAAGKALGLTLLELRAGAHFRALVQNGEDGYPSQFDSRDDQFSIREGVKYANAHNYMNVFYRVAVGSLKIVGNVY